MPRGRRHHGAFAASENAMPTPRTLSVDARESGQTLAAFLKHRLGISWAQARQWIAQGRISLGGRVCRDAVRPLHRGEQVIVGRPRRPGCHLAEAAHVSRPTKRVGRPAVTPVVPPAIALVHVDDAILVVEKPPGITTVRHRHEAAEFGPRARRYLPSTLADWLPRLLGDRRPVYAVHRLDHDTSGLLVFARTREAEAELGRQFRAHQVGRRYLAVVRGCPGTRTVESMLIDDRGDGRRGSSSSARGGRRAVTHLRVVEQFGEFSLVECRLETGRTHQVRIHLGELGTPLCGERIYDRPVHGRPLPDRSGAPRVALHAAYLGLHHPTTGTWLEWESPLPEDLLEMVRRLRQRSVTDSTATTEERSKKQFDDQNGENQSENPRHRQHGEGQPPR